MPNNHKNGRIDSSSQILISENDHIKSSLVYYQNDLLNELQNLKVKVLNDVLDFYITYPTLHRLYLTWYEKPSGRCHEGWNVFLSQAAWDTVENIIATQEYKDSGLNIYAFCNNNMKYDENIIPYGNNKFTSYNKIQSELKDRFNYLLKDKELGIRFKNEINKIITNPSDKNSISIETYNWYGFKNFKFDQKVKEFLGNDVLDIFLYLNLNENIQDKETKSTKRKI